MTRIKRNGIRKSKFTEEQRKAATEKTMSELPGLIEKVIREEKGKQIIKKGEQVSINELIEKAKENIRSEFPNLDINKLSERWQKGDNFAFHTAVEAEGISALSTEGINKQDLLLRNMTRIENLKNIKRIQDTVKNK